MFIWVQKNFKKMFIDMTDAKISKYFSKIKVKKEILQKYNFYKKNLKGMIKY